MSEVKIPQTLNGYPVKACMPRNGFGKDGSYVVLVHREGHFQPWVTAVWSATLEDSWVWGHYMEDYEDAKADLIDRAK